MSDNMTETLVALVYWTIPSQVTAQSITGITKTASSLVQVSFTYNGTVQIIDCTPAAFTNWYSANATSISNSGNSALLSGWNTTLASSQAELSAYVTSHSLAWVAYATYQGMGIYQIPSGIYATSTSNLYALINPNEAPIDWTPIFVQLVLLTAGFFVLYLIILNFTSGKFKIGGGEKSTVGRKGLGLRKGPGFFSGMLKGMTTPPDAKPQSRQERKEEKEISGLRKKVERKRLETELAGGTRDKSAESDSEARKFATEERRLVEQDLITVAEIRKQQKQLLMTEDEGQRATIKENIAILKERLQVVKE